MLEELNCAVWLIIATEADCGTMNHTGPLWVLNIISTQRLWVMSIEYM